jgi:penicillin amidase
VLSEYYPHLSEILDPPSVPLGGDGDTPMAANFSPTDPFTITGSSAARYVFDLSDWNNSRWIVPLGSSGNPGSPHYSDQSGQWADLKLNEMLYAWDSIESNYENHQTIIADI